MNQVFIFGPILVLILAGVVVGALRVNSRIGYSHVVVKDWRRATYYHGKEGEKVSPSLADRIYARDGYRCQYPGCSARVYEGNANNLKEHALGLAGAKPGNINHRFVPFYYGGPAIPENLEVMCQPHNIKRGKKVTRKALRWMAERGETICLNNKDLLN